MAVIRSDTRIFPWSQEQTRLHVLEVLGRPCLGYRYVDTESDARTAIITTRIKPHLWPLMLSTQFTIELEQLSDSCVVRVSTRSQPYISGDVFDFYDKYIRHFLTALQDVIHSSA